jgi:ethanolamine utilization protein EutM
MSREALGLIETKGMLGAIEVTRAATQAAEVSIASAEHTESGRVIVKIEGDWGAVVAAVDAGARAAEQAQQLVSMHVIPRPNEMVSPILPYQLFIDRYYPTGDLVRAVRPAAEIRRPKPTRTTTTPPAASKPAPIPKPSLTAKPSLTIKPSTTAKPKPAPKPVVTKPKPRPTTVTPPPAPATVSFQSAKAERPATGAILSMAELEAMPVVKLRQYARTLPNLPIQGRQISMANKQQLLEAIKTIT